MPRHTHPRDVRTRRPRGSHRIHPEDLVTNAHAAVVGKPSNGHRRARLAAAQLILSRHVDHAIERLMTRDNNTGQLPVGV